MTGSQLISMLASSIQVRLPGWTVYNTPQPDPSDRSVELGLGPAVATHYQFGSPAVSETVLIRMYIRNSPGAYEELSDARDGVVRAVFDVYPTLLSNDVELLPESQAATMETPQPVAGATQQVFWVVEIRVPARRRVVE